MDKIAKSLFTVFQTLMSPSKAVKRYPLTSTPLNLISSSSPRQVYSRITDVGKAMGEILNSQKVFVSTCSPGRVRILVSRPRKCRAVQSPTVIEGDLLAYRATPAFRREESPAISIFVVGVAVAVAVQGTPTAFRREEIAVGKVVGVVVAVAAQGTPTTFRHEEIAVGIVVGVVVILTVVIL